MNPEELPLRDIHLPERVGWWPPAPGWWVLALLLLAMITFLLLAWRRRRARERALDLALRELDQLQREYQANTKSLLRELSVLLRRVAISQYGRRKVSGFTGKAWVEFLNRKAGKKLFSGELEPLLTELPYRPECEVDTRRFAKAIRQWIRLQRRNADV